MAALEGVKMTKEQWIFAATMVFKPLAALAFLWVAMLISKRITRYIPEGRVKRLLLKRLN